ncbi:MAG: RibD family protein [Methanotrichaceae archaeon]|nr:RibD family protein [Methanotrichaceae archaeon]
MLPRVILHNAVSLDGKIDGFPVDLGQYYQLASLWNEDVTLAGADTILKAAENAPPEEESAFRPPATDPADRRPLLAIPDSRGRVRCWHFLRTQSYWRGFVALCSHSTPGDYLDYLKERGIDCILAGKDHVDLRAALFELSARYGAEVVRADSGGTLNGVLLAEGLVDEVSVLVYPALVGDPATRSLFQASDPAKPQGSFSLRLKSVDRLEGDVVWLRYGIEK